MKISVNNISFDYSDAQSSTALSGVDKQTQNGVTHKKRNPGSNKREGFSPSSASGKPIFKNFNAQFESTKRPLVILGSSGSGKTTLLKLLGGLLKPKSGSIIYLNDKTDQQALPQTSFLFQEPRLLPWLTVLENVRIPLEKHFGREKSTERAKDFLSLVSLEEKANSYPLQLSGGQAQRVSMARAFAWPASVILMDEPFQSLDIPLRISMMDTTLSLLEKEKRLLIIVTHDPREAVYIGERIIVIGKAGEGIVFDKEIDLNAEERTFGSAAARELENQMIRCLV